MASEDTGPASQAEPPLAPLGVGELTRSALVDYGRRIAEATWDLGLSRWFWPEGVALIGLADFGLAAGSDDRVRVRDWVDGMLASTPPVEHVNDLTPAAAAAAVGTDPALLRPYVEWIRQAPRAANGAVEHWKDGLWADTMFMVGALTARLGVTTRDPGLVQDAVSQYLLHAQVLQCDRSGLFAHGSHRGQTLWNFWGRANAWAALTGVEILEAASILELPPETSPALAEVRQRLERQLETLAACQPDHGVWDVLVDGCPETAGILETSASAGLAAAMIRSASAAGDSMAGSVGEAGWLALRGVLAYTDERGRLGQVSAGTILQLLPFGYAVIRSDRPQLWGQGLALAAVSAALAVMGEPEDKQA